MLPTWIGCECPINANATPKQKNLLRTAFASEREEMADASTKEGTGWCSSADKHVAAFAVRALFGFVLAIFCMGGLIYEMVYGGSRTEFIAMYFSLLSFASGYFLGATPGIKRPTEIPTTIPGSIQEMTPLTTQTEEEGGESV
jgi:hypothetical protein